VSKIEEKKMLLYINRMEKFGNYLVRKKKYYNIHLHFLGIFSKDFLREYVIIVCYHEKLIL
jgi:hypothetical protein